MEAFDRAAQTHLASGSLLTVDNQIDTATGTVKAKAVFGNEDGALFPNQFVNIRLILQEKRNAIVIPASALQTGSQGNFVYLLKEGQPPAELVEKKNTDMPASAAGREPVELLRSGADGERGADRGDAGDLERRREAGRPDCGGWAGEAEERKQGVSEDGSGEDEGRRLRLMAVGEAARQAFMSSRLSPSRPFILRPVATSLLMVAILLAGFVAYLQLPVSALPQVDYPTIQVQTFYPGASPEVMASSVTAPLERQFGQIPGLSQMTSTSSGGGSVITLQFSLAGVDRRGAAGCAGGDQRGVTAICRRTCRIPPVYSKVNPADAPIMTLALTSDTLPLDEGGRPGGYGDRAEDLAAVGRGVGVDQRRTEASGADPGESDGAGELWAESGGHSRGGGRRRMWTRRREI